MMRIIEKFKSGIRNRTTYRVGLLQAKVYKVLKTYTSEKLAPHKLSTIDWALLGLLYDNVKGMRSGDVAEELSVEAPFVTVLTSKLKKMNLIEIKKDSTDSRVKIMMLTEKGKNFVPKMDKELLQEMRILITGTPMKDVFSYINVLEHIVKNSKHITLKKSRQAYYEGV